jgi:hypothetical protein
LIDPRATVRSFTIKHVTTFYGLCFAGFLLFTNHLDAIQIPPGDRRFGVLSNGEQMTGEMAKALQTWMEQEGNIAALSRWLEARNIEKFEPFKAPETMAKKAMQEMAMSERDEAFLTVRKLFGKAALFTGAQFHRAMRAEVPQRIGAREDFATWVDHRLRQSTTSDSRRFRMPPREIDKKRPLILRWRDYDGPVLEKVEDAQAKVAITEKLLEAENEAVANTLRGLYVLHGKTID